MKSHTRDRILANIINKLIIIKAYYALMIKIVKNEG